MTLCVSGVPGGVRLLGSLTRFPRSFGSFCVKAERAMTESQPAARAAEISCSWTWEANATIRTGRVEGSVFEGSIQSSAEGGTEVQDNCLGSGLGDGSQAASRITRNHHYANSSGGFPNLSQEE